MVAVIIVGGPTYNNLKYIPFHSSCNSNISETKNRYSDIKFSTGFLWFVALVTCHGFLQQIAVVNV